MSIVLKQRIQALTARVEELERKANKPVEVVIEDPNDTLMDILDALTVRVEALETPDKPKRVRRSKEQIEADKARSEGSEA